MFVNREAFIEVTSNQDGGWSLDDDRWKIVDDIQRFSGYGDDEFDILYEDVEEYWVSIVADLETVPEDFNEYIVETSLVPNEVITAHNIA